MRLAIHDYNSANVNEPHQKHAIHRQQRQQHVEESAISIRPTACRTHTSTHTRPIGTQSGVGRQPKKK